MVDLYFATKIVHVTSASLSIIIFALRGGRRLLGRTIWFTNRLKIVPHLIDTLLLVTGIVLIRITHQYPGTESWITIKLGAVVVYILLGMVALKFASSNKWSAMAFVAALSVFIGIVVLVLNRSFIDV